MWAWLSTISSSRIVMSLLSPCRVLSLLTLDAGVFDDLVPAGAVELELLCHLLRSQRAGAGAELGEALLDVRHLGDLDERRIQLVDRLLRRAAKGVERVPA